MQDSQQKQASSKGKTDPKPGDRARREAEELLNSLGIPELSLLKK